ncbi:alpha- and gamma-adaptin-binding protein p34 isoform X1 [Scyliorhinus canicula]|uniref:alpha- and gamma-adaptin-binding protein p34 isoform X1 n=1 Tax=Scyliorhinus canicula TaxID=7830 RepID=UPI0018F66D80|nr:alpha- and gamma-adaptin-binding protein p34 isoform X1 [Scyliorhinus canicula]
MELPSVLLVSCCPAFVEEALVKDIIGSDDLPEYTGPGNEVRSYPWTIDNKYYTATVQVCVVPNQFTLTAEIADTVEAFLIYFDSTTKSGLDEVSTWLPLTQAWTPEVLILVCDRVSDNGVSRQTAQQWCIKYGFELVELNPEELPDEEDDFPESTGVTRIIQALNANVWSNVEMKTDRPQDFGILSSLTGVLENCGTEVETQVEYQSLLEPDAESHAEDSDRVAAPQPDSVIADPMLHLDIQELATLTTGEVDCENFERLFEKLKEMKDKAATLPHEQRKLHAEKVAKAFWMAIGGDREEIEEPSDEEND